MRAAILGLASVLVAGNAFAADYLRGSTYEAPAGYRWAGWYVGGQVGYTAADFNFSSSTQALVANLVRALLVEEEFGVSSLPNLPSRDRRGLSYGGFVGYNASWGDVVMGLEFNYSHTSLTATTQELIGRAFTTSTELRNDVFIASNATATLTDFASFRVRAGYPMGWVMPYGMVGFALGMVNYQRSVNVQIFETDVSTDPPTPGGTLNEIATDARNNALTYGFVAGAGVDIGLFSNLFLRAEYEFMQLARVGGISIRTSTFRGGAGFKF